MDDDPDPYSNQWPMSPNNSSWGTVVYFMRRQLRPPITLQLPQSSGSCWYAWAAPCWRSCSPRAGARSSPGGAASSTTLGIARGDCRPLCASSVATGWINILNDTKHKKKQFLSVDNISTVVYQSVARGLNLGLGLVPWLLTGFLTLRTAKTALAKYVNQIRASYYFGISPKYLVSSNYLYNIY